MTSPVFGLPHLSEDAVAAFADGVLSAAAASRAQRHCAECVECADAVRGQRETAMMLRAAQAPALPSGLLDRLAGLPMSTPLPPPSRGGLPTALGPDGTAMFIAHDARKARDAHARDMQALAVQAGSSSVEQPGAVAQPPVRPSHRRGALPVTVLASAAAVLAAGTFGGQVSTLAAAADRQAPANVAGSLTGNSNRAPRSPSPLTAVGALLDVSRPPTSPTSTATDQATRPALRPGSQPTTSVTLTPGRQAPQRPSAATSVGSLSWSRLAASQAQADHSTAAGDQRPTAGFVPTMAGAPVATP
ncbi:MAG: hypothetical protein ABIQ09_20510 [Jatrophihabitantaceae bacterium]